MLITAPIGSGDRRGVQEVMTQLTDLMVTIHGVHAGANIQRNGGRVRGYPHVEFTEKAKNDY